MLATYETKHNTDDARIPTIRVGLLGFGVVGEGTYRMLRQNAEAIFSKTGTRIEVTHIGIKDATKPRTAPQHLFTTDLNSVVGDPQIDVVIEAIGGISPAGELIELALRNGKHVVTANKKLLARHGTSLMRLAAEHGLDLHFEGAVGGGIPLLQPLKHQLAGNDVLKLMGILNGTTNYILTRMAEGGSCFKKALAEAQDQGYAEADPTDDVEGHDVASKLAILASIAYGREVDPEQIHCQGITQISARDIELAKGFGFTIKLVGIAERVGEHEILARVHPTLLPVSHPLAAINGVYNALWIRGNFVGDLMFSGRGAGADPTGSAIVGDLIDIARNIRIGGSANVTLPDEGQPLLDIEALETGYYVRLIVDDKPSVLGDVATAFGNRGISLSDMQMKVVDTENCLGEIVFLTHRCGEDRFQAAIDALQEVGTIREVANWIRVENGHSENQGNCPDSNN